VLIGTLVDVLVGGGFWLDLLVDGIENIGGARLELNLLLDGIGKVGTARPELKLVLEKT
jgi:hypothetical protein